MTPKEQFLNEPGSPDRPTHAERLRMLVREPWFRHVLVFARAQFLSSGITNQDFVNGALRFEATLLDLAEEAPSAEDIPQAQLAHDLDSVSRTPNNPQPNL